MAFPDNIFWAAFAGEQRHLTVGTDRARRYQPGIAELVAFDDDDQPAFEDLEPHCRSGEAFYGGNLRLGRYRGIFEDGRLVAMAGERLHAGCHREVSAVCTDPRQQGRGLAGELVRGLVREQLARGEQPFLHVMAANTGAISLYRKLGFEVVRTVPIRMVART